MNIERVRNYNTWALAAISSLGALLLLIGVLTLTLELIRSLPSSKSDVGVSVSETFDQTDNKTQVRPPALASFDQWLLVDTLAQIYALPLGQAGVAQPEPRSGRLFAKSDYSSHYLPEGHAHNMVIYQAAQQQSRLLWPQAVHLIQYSVEQLGRQSLLCLWLSPVDTNNDGFTNLADQTQVQIYQPSTQQLHTVAVEGASVRELFFLHPVALVGLRVSFDKNKDRQFDHTDPSAFYTYSLEKQELRPVIDDQLSKQAQEMVANAAKQ